MKNIKRFVLAVLGVLLFPSLVFAQTVLDPGALGFDPLPIVKMIKDGAQAGLWGPAVIGLLLLAVFGIRFAAKTWPTFKLVAWTKTTAGGWGLNLGGSALAALAALFGSGGPITVATVLGAMVSAAITAFAAAGALEAVKDKLGGAKAAGSAAGLTVVSKQDALDELK